MLCATDKLIQKTIRITKEQHFKYRTKFLNMNLQTCIQNYHWGKRGISSYVAQLIHGKSGNEHIDENVPYAELWMGTHPSGPSVISNSNKTLSQYIEENPECLGEKILLKFGNQLPYLFKILSVDTALSIQAHPDKNLAKKLHDSRPDLYKDANHKPELAIALTTFEALCGFRPFKEIKSFFQSIPELIAVVGAQNVAKFLTSSETESPNVLRECLKSLITQEPNVISEQLQLLLTRAKSLDEDNRRIQLISLVERLNIQYPNDVGCFVVYFLNYLKLSPGQAIYLGANEPHAYLSGDCVECMSCSDNVVRAGLTPKFKDVNTLCTMLSYNMEKAKAKIFKPLRENDFTELYAPPIEDFAVAKINVVNNQSSIILIPRNSASILLILNGKGKYNDNSYVTKGSVLFLHANTSFRIDEISSDFIAYQAFANV